MKKPTMKVRNWLLLPVTGLVVLSGIHTSYAQAEQRWLSIGELQSYYNAIGAEYELRLNWFSWPAQYGLVQSTVRAKGLWIGCKNFYDSKAGKILIFKVIGSGPRDFADRPNQIFEKEIKLIGIYEHPTVVVDGETATVNSIYDVLDEIDETLPADRMIMVKFNTSIGVSVTKKILAFSQQNHDNYFIYDYVFKNTGIIDREGTVYYQTLEDLWIYFLHRYALSGESVLEYNQGWGVWSSSWGVNTLNHAFGEDPTDPDFEMRAFYSWYGPNQDRAVSYNEDWGCPNQLDDGVLGSASYAGCVTLHADKGPNDYSDDLDQPKTTWFISSDLDIMETNVSQYDELFMQDRYNAMSEGHPDKSHDEYVGNDYTSSYSDPRRNGPGGTSQGQGYGPYALAPGGSIHIVFAEGVSGLSREKNREVGANWLQYYKGIGTPMLIMPDGSTTTDHNLYKRKWVETGKDSILNTYRKAIWNYWSGYAIPQPPPPPSIFEVESGHDMIRLTWSDNADSWPNFNGYVIYRSEGNVMDPKTEYKKIFECSKVDVVHIYDDTLAFRGFDYYYYIQSKDDGSTNDMQPGKPLVSSMFWTLTSKPAYLRNPDGVESKSTLPIPKKYELSQNFPNPFNPMTTIRFGLPETGHVTLKICNIRGEEIQTLIDGKTMSEGYHVAVWDGRNKRGEAVPSGIYLYRLDIDRCSLIKKLVFSK